MGSEGASRSIHFFNPTLVRLRRRESLIEFDFKLDFQSHAGSIEARGRPTPGSTPPCLFNPTLVRLRRAVTDNGIMIDQKKFSIPRWFD